MDFSKAFDLVDHESLIQCLETCGVDIKTKSFIGRFLRRKQLVKVNKSISEAVDVTSGVPQGSCTGPICFNIFSDSMSTCVRNSDTKIVRYADDTTIYCHSYYRLQEAIDDISKWSFENNLRINSSKTKIISLKFNYDKDTVLDSLKLNGSLVENVTTHKFLGIVIDNSLCFTSHVDYIIKKAKGKLHLILKAKRSGDLVYLYRSVVLPVLDYASAVWSGYCYEKDINRIENFEKRSLRNIFGTNSGSASESII
ncbi:Uncharacterised protein at_DN0278 [Pycnogonum litorale]